MNIALCYESIVPARGGCETYIADLVRRLVADRHEVHLYAYERDAKALPAPVVFHALMAGGGPRFLRPWRFGAACARALRDAAHDVVVGFVKTWHQDVIIPQGGLHVASAEGNVRKHRRAWVRGLARAVKALDLAHWSYRLLERRQYLRPNPPLIVVPSRMVQTHFAEYYGIDAGQVRVIPNAIDPGRFQERDRLRLRAELRKKHGLAPDDVVGLFVGHNYHLKGLEPLLYAVRELPPGPFKLLVCGGAKFGRYQRLAERLGVTGQVRFLGYCPEVRGCFFASDLLVHPTFYDPCSLVVLEALACGLPVITSRSNGAAELLHAPADGTVLDDPHDSQALARHIEQWCDPARRAAGSKAARQAAAAWTFEDHYQALLQVFREAARRKQAA